MCLTVNKEDFDGKIAEQDMKIYKTFGDVKLFGLGFVPGFYWKFMYLYRKPTKRVKIEISGDYNCKFPVSPEAFCGYIGKGYHGFNKAYIDIYYSHSYEVYEFIIPKGTRYFEYTHGDGGMEICAERVYYNGRIKTRQ